MPIIFIVKFDTCSIHVICLLLKAPAGAALQLL